MAHTIRFSVIIVTHNHRQHIQRCLVALLPTVGREGEVILVDNNSVDGTLEYASNEFPQVRSIANAHNRGFGAACNQAARQSASEFLVFLNPDTEVRAGWLDPLLEALRTMPGVGLATPKILLRARPDRIDTFGHNVHISGLATCRGWGQASQSYEDVEEVAAISGACFAVRRGVFARLGGFDEQLFLYYEDDDLSLRARMAGFTCVAVPTSRVLHDHRADLSPEKLRYLERNRVWTTFKLYSWSTLLALGPVMLVAEVLGWGVACLYGRRHMLSKLRAWWDILGWLPDLPRVRGQVEHCIADKAVLRAHRTPLESVQVAKGPLARGAECVANLAFAALAPRW